MFVAKTSHKLGDDSRKDGENQTMTEDNTYQEDNNGEGLKNWFQDNIRIILSVLIVVAIAAGIYSYSQRTDVPTDEEIAMEDEFTTDGDDEEAVTIVGEDEDGATTANGSANGTVVDIERGKGGGKGAGSANTETPASATTTVTGPQGEVSTKSTDGTYTQTAQAGDSLTILARRAMTDYLADNPDSSLTAEHKVYIEDYMRKHVGHKGGVSVGSQVSFSSSLISQAVSSSKNLTQYELDYLKKFSAKVGY